MDAFDQENVWAPLLNYWVSLDHSVDPDQISLKDMTAYQNTGEHQGWPVRHGLGTMVARFGANVPVRLNSAVDAEALAWELASIRS